MNEIWNLSLDEYIEICERAMADGVQPGESLEKYLREFMAEKNRTPIAYTEQDQDILTGNLRESGLKVFNLRELQRRLENNE